MTQRTTNLFITLEGIEGSGKSSQIPQLTAFLEKHGYAVCQTREPGGTALGLRLRHILVEPQTEELAPLSELLLYTTDRHQHVVHRIQPALDAGQCVLCDRFIDSTLAYQAYARGIDLNLVQNLITLSTNGLKPDITLLFDCDVALGLRRSRQRLAASGSHEDRFEQETLAFHERVRAAYLQLAAAEPQRFIIIDASQSIEAVWNQVKTRLAPRLAS